MKVQSISTHNVDHLRFVVIYQWHLAIVSFTKYEESSADFYTLKCFMLPS